MIDAYWERCDPGYIDGEGAESLIELLERVKSFLGRLESYKSGFIAAFSHGQFIRAILWSLLIRSGEMRPESMKQFYRFLQSFPFPNAAIIKLEFESMEEVRFSNIIISHLPPQMVSY